MGGVQCERALKFHLSRKGLSGKARAKTGIGKSDLPGLQGGPGKRDFVYDKVRAPRLYPDPGNWFAPPGLLVEKCNKVQNCVPIPCSITLVRKKREVKIFCPDLWYFG
jgi:hypothetical protein